MKAIETKYKGYRFRSRLEARWAVFFDALGLQWEYEPEGFDLGDAGWYLPDFRITTDCGESQYWFEVKGKKATKIDIDKLQALCDATGMNGYISSGTMDVPIFQTGRKNKLSISGSIIYRRFPSANLKIYDESLSADDCNDFGGQILQLENNCICGFYQDSNGLIDIDHVYADDTMKDRDMAATGEKFMVTPMENGENVDIAAGFIAQGYSVWAIYKVTEEMTLIGPGINVGSGRFYRSNKLKSAYESARSARFEHGETPKC